MTPPDLHVDLGRHEPTATLCGEPECVGGFVTIGDTSRPCAECVRLGYVDAATGQVLLMEGERP